MKKRTLLILLFFVSVSLFAQENTQEKADLFTYEKNDTSEDGTHHYLVAITGSMLPSVICYSWNNFVLQAGWAKLDEEELAKFYNRDLKFDDDWVATNFLGHPYQGGLYYMVSRSSNLNQFESFCISVLGSYVWEFVCEANAPSINDMAYTTFGAFSMGEMLYRLSFEAGEVWFPLEYILNPMLLYAKPFVKDRNKIPSGNIYAFSTTVGTGLGLGYNNSLSSAFGSINEKYFYIGELGLDVVYKDPYGHEGNNAYDQFQMSLFAGLGPENNVQQEKPLEKQVSYNFSLLSDGTLKTYAPEFGEKGKIDTTIGFTMMYDFAWKNFYEFSSLAPAIAIKQRFNFDNYSLAYQSQLGYNILGITEFNYYRRKLDPSSNDARTYNYVTGLEGANKFEWKYDKNSLNFNQRYFICRDFYDTEADNYTGWEFYTLMQLNYEYAFTKLVSLGLSNEVYLKYSIYDDLPNYFSSYYSGNIFVRFNLKK